MSLFDDLPEPSAVECLSGNDNILKTVIPKYGNFIDDQKSQTIEVTHQDDSGLAQIERDIRRVLYDTFKKTDEDFLKEASQQRPHWRDGSTASTVLFVNDTVYIANLGDSKVVLARTVDVVAPISVSNNGVEENEKIEGSRVNCICLTRDHNPIDYDERQRIQAAGGTVQNGRVNNTLEVSRSFGDYQFKKQGVTCIPDVRKCKVTADDRFLLIACDGLWKSLSPDKAVELTNRLLEKELCASKDKNYPSEPPNGPLSQRQLDNVCSQLVNEAVLRMSGDNVTCILIAFPDSFLKPNTHSLKQPADPTDASDEPKAKTLRLE